jgi:ABC-type microcin C transport system permease subunit YejB
MAGVVRMVLSRLVQAVPSLLGVTLIAFVLLQLSGDVTQLLLPMEIFLRRKIGRKKRKGRKTRMGNVHHEDHEGKKRQSKSLLRTSCPFVCFVVKNKQARFNG